MSPPSGRSERVVAACSWGLLVGALLTYFRGPLVLGEAFFERDVLRVYYPLKSYWAAQVLQGHFPQWYPDDSLGQPFVGMVISGAFHPFNLLWLIFSKETSMTLGTIACLPIAALGIRALARELGASSSGAWLGALAFSLSGSMLSATNNSPYLQAAAMVPTALWAALRGRTDLRFVGIAAAACTLQLFAGDPFSFGLTSLFVSLILAHTRVTRAICFGLLTLGLSAAQLIPTLAIRTETAGARNTEFEALTWSAHPLRLLELAMGPLFLDPTTQAPLGEEVTRRLLGADMSEPWVASHFIGTLVVGLAVLSVRSVLRRDGGKSWLIAWLFVVALWLGKFVGLFTLLHGLPMAQAFRFPEKTWPFVMLGVAVAAALGTSTVLQADSRLASRGAALLVLCGVVAWLTPLFWSTIGAGHGLSAKSIASLTSNSFSALVAAGGALVLVSLTVRFLPQSTHRGLALQLVVVAQGLWAHHALVKTANGPLLTTPPALVAMALENQNGRPGRLLSTLRGAGTLHGAEDDENTATALLLLNTCGPVMPSLWGLEGSGVYLPGFHERVRLLDADLNRWAPLVNTRFHVLAEGDARAADKRFTVIGTLPIMRLTLVEDSLALPRAFVAEPRWTHGESDLLLPDDPAIASGRVAAVESNELFSPTAVTGAARIEPGTPERVVVHATASGPAVVVINQAWYPGWTATVDGQTAKILPANHMVDAISVTAGSHEIVLTYQQPGLLLGVALSALASALLLTILMRKPEPSAHF